MIKIKPRTFSVSKSEVHSLVDWYHQNKRPLPWRSSKDPYKIWLSEVMLQQTTATAVIPYYQNFLKVFPDLESLAQSPIERVFLAWSGLGYYSRARNLHKAASKLVKNFPKTAAELIQIPGFGPYTSRSVASIAFEEPVGVLDGNVIRFLSRYYNYGWKSWVSEDRKIMQELADSWAQKPLLAPSQVNQALMELGATICTPKSASCGLCPLQKTCMSAFDIKTQEKLPLKKPKRQQELWLWEPEILLRNGHCGLTENKYAPFLSGHLIPPGKAKKITKKPADFYLTATVTHHKIFVKPQVLKKHPKGLVWVRQDELQQKSPSSLVRKVYRFIKG